MTASPSTRHRLVTAMLPVVSSAYLQADLRGLGVVGDGPGAAPFDTVRAALPPVPDPPPPSSATRPGLAFEAMFAARKAVAVVKPRTAEETGYALEALRTFLGHGDAARVARADLARWRDALKAEGRTNNTWNNRLSLLRQVFALAVGEGLLPVNPADNGLRLRKNRAAVRLPYSDEEAARILLAARAERRPSLRWAHWVMAFTGMRASEVLQLQGGDVRQEGAIWLIDVNEDGPGKSVKNGQPRHVPVHPALLEEGFVAYAHSLGAGDPLFPDKKPDHLGNRGGRAWNLVGKWVRETVGITDLRKAPDHSWRHRMEDELRAAGVYEADRDAILGHARKTTGRLYGVRGEALERLHRELSRVPLPKALAS